VKGRKNPWRNAESVRAHRVGCLIAAARRKKRASPEHDLHRAVADYLRVALKPPTIWTTIGHGGGGRVRGAMLKAAGVQKGWPDILIMHYAGMSYRGVKVVGIELKAAKGRLSPAQKATDSAFFGVGAHYFIARSVDEVEGFLRGVGIPLHATLTAKAAA
jgi:hypothetical protein